MCDSHALRAEGSRSKHAKTRDVKEKVTKLASTLVIFFFPYRTPFSTTPPPTRPNTPRRTRNGSKTCARKKKNEALWRGTGGGCLWDRGRQGVVREKENHYSTPTVPNCKAKLRPWTTVSKSPTVHKVLVS